MKTNSVVATTNDSRNQQTTTTPQPISQTVTDAAGFTQVGATGRLGTKVDSVTEKGFLQEEGRHAEMLAHIDALMLLPKQARIDISYILQFSVKKQEAEDKLATHSRNIDFLLKRVMADDTGVYGNAYLPEGEDDA